MVENERRKPGRRPGDQRLTPRKAKFLEAYLASGNGTQSAIAAGYAPGRANNAAWRLLNHDKAVMAAVEQSHKAIQKQGEISAMSMISQFDEDRKLAIANKQMNAAVQASVNKAKVAGLMIDRSDVRTAAQLQVVVRRFSDDS